MKTTLLKMLNQSAPMLLGLFFVLVFQQTYAQGQIEVTGTVTSASDGVPLPSVNIIVKNTSIGTLTDFDGNYTLEVPSDGTLVFSSIGLKTKELPVDGKTEVNVTLEEDMAELDQVVVTGYTSQEKKSITGAISTVTSEDLEKVHGGSTVSSGLAGEDSRRQL